MDYLGEALALGVDSLLFGICCKYYLRQRHAVKAVQNAPVIDVSSKLDDLISESPEKTIAYAAIRGVVKPLGSPITSINHPDVTGTIQKLSVKEHVFTRNSAGFWGEQHRPIQEVYNIVPFVLQSGRNKVEVTDVLDADILDLETIADHFEPTTSSALEHLWGFFTGIRRQGIQNKEEMLRVGALVTGIGEIKASKEGLVKLAAPSDGTPYYLTVLPISSLIRRLEEQKRLYRFYMLIFGGVAIFIAGLITHRWWKEQLRKRKEEEMHRRVEAMRRQRRAQVRDSELPESQLCVVCRQNPREVILLPCGHVCLCEDCGDGINDFCPICRTKIDNKAAAYIA